MQDLIELVNLIQRTKFKANGLLEVIVEPESHMGQLFDAIAQKKVRTDEDAKTLFPEAMKDAGRLATIKSKLKDRLTDSVFLLGFKESNYADRHRAFFECTKKWASAMLLINKNARLNGINALEKLLRHTEQFEFTELTIDILRVLRLHYGLVEGNEQQYTFYENRLREVEEIGAAENQVEALYTDLVIRYVNSKADKNAITEKAQDYHKKAAPLLRRYSTFKIQMFGRLIETIIYDSQNNYKEMTRVCEESIAFFEAKPYQTTLSLQVFYYNLVVCYLSSRMFDKCRGIIEKFDQFLEEGSFNWFKMQELSFFTQMHAGNYAAAFQTYKKVADHPNFETVSAPVAELWKILDAYLCFLLYVGLLKPNTDGAPGEQQIKFRLNRFLNEVPVFSKDKRGMNIPVLIIQFIYLLADGKFEACEERVDALNKYRLRYLYDRETLRSSCFIKFLASIPGSGFNSSKLKNKISKLRECLAANPWYAVPQSLEIEIVPYEDLLEIVLHCI
ncbi:MAG: hypothetical protein JNL02_16380 [Saprospiraceae bacterium]|nr:hypothetical protein [Saprospiraceae bacterium]